MKMVCIKNDMKPLNNNIFKFSHIVCYMDIDKKEEQITSVYQTMFYQN